jgi:hypothetical protein
MIDLIEVIGRREEEEGHAHGGPDVRYFKDGDQWCAVRKGFVNLQESPAGFGSSQGDALADLEKSEKGGDRDHK